MKVLVTLLLLAAMIPLRAIELPPDMKVVRASPTNDTLLCRSDSAYPGMCSMHSRTQDWYLTPEQYARQAHYKLVRVYAGIMDGDLYIIMEVTKGQ